MRGLIPDAIVDRKKQGFGVPIYEWFFDRLGDKAKRELNDFCDRTDYLDRTEVMHLFNKGRAWDAWILLNFSMWWKQYIR